MLDHGLTSTTTLLWIGIAASALWGCGEGGGTNATGASGGAASTGGSTAPATGGGGASRSSGTGGSVAVGGSTAAGGSTTPTGGSATTGGTQSTGGIEGPGGALSGGSGGSSTSSGGTGIGGASDGGSAGQQTGGVAGVGGSTGPECDAPAPSTGPVAADASGVTFTLNAGLLRLDVCTEEILRVQYTSDPSLPAKTSLSVISDACGTPTFCVDVESETATITTARLKAKVDTNNGVVSYTDLNDNAVLSEDGKSVTDSIETVFNSPSDEGLFGLGQHQDGVFNKKGRRVHFHNVNDNNANSPTSGGDITIPLLVSSRGYGVYWDNAADGDFYGDDSGNTKYRFSSNAGDTVDYYFLYGPTIDQVIARYRTVTGAAPLFPKWAYGLFQSKDAYGNQSEILAVKDGYRNNDIPVDCIVQDWNYWTPYAQGSHIMDPSRYPDPEQLVNEMHAANVHTMISIWPRYEMKNNPPLVSGENDNYNALSDINALFLGGTPGYPPPYDPYNAEARTLVYQQIYDGLVGRYGWDAIWADATEPEGINLNTMTTAIGNGSLYINAYPLQHSQALYEGWRSVGPNDKRVFILTRSGFGGQQRFGASCWSGDIGSDMATYARQVPAGLGFAISGMPYWTTDIGGYFGHSVDWSTAQNNELFTRWFQFGAFCSLFRIHGGGSRELYGNQWSATTKANVLSFDHLHYRLMPYIYSLAWKVTNEDYTIMRPLVFDFQSDSAVYDIVDQFMYGPAFLVNPVTTAGATSRSVYLPAGTWYDFWTGSTSDGGTTTSVSAPLDRIPLFVKAGSIVPMGPLVQYATESIDPLEIRIYKGANASFTLYEDEGDSYNYETGEYSTIQLTWDDAAQQLKIGARSGSYAGMPENRTFNVVWVEPDHGIGPDLTNADQMVEYDGSEVTVDAG